MLFKDKENKVIEIHCATLMKEIDMTLKTGDINTFEQPIFDIRNKKEIATELLNRPSAQSTFSSPDQFYSFAAGHGQIHKVDTFVLRAGVERLLKKSSQPSFVFVNIHLSTLFTDDWQDMLPHIKTSKFQIVLELSEREGLGNYTKEEVIRKMKELRELGMRIAVDDIGKGYSGLHTLAMVEPDFVKIDRDLVKDIGHDSYRQHMMKALIDYWLQQDVSIIAEGVETEEEVLFFKNHGVPFFQGYYFMRPKLVKVEE
ncbi:EAL domain-containing protein [Metabacillus sp. B2-18]|nr:EAL domain-containing protein [Metabacillus sp. B2-18]UGB30979.1 EAL domain-containing protein [Metabacillus sp. B2-18]